MNDPGQIMGSYQDANGEGTRVRGGVFATIDFPGPGTGRYRGHQRFRPHGRQQFYAGSDSRFHSFLYSAGVFSTIDIPGATYIQVTAINDSGQIVGFYAEASGGFGFVDTAGLFTTIAFPGAVETDVRAINDFAEMAGVYSDAHGFFHTFVDNNGNFATVYGGRMGPPLSHGGINDSGQIVGGDGIYTLGPARARNARPVLYRCAWVAAGGHRVP